MHFSSFQHKRDGLDAAQQQLVGDLLRDGRLARRHRPTGGGEDHLHTALLERLSCHLVVEPRAAGTRAARMASQSESTWLLLVGEAVIVVGIAASGAVLEHLECGM
jgi:hypothetical protein